MAEVKTLLIPETVFYSSLMSELGKGDTFRFCGINYMYESENLYPYRTGLIEIWAMPISDDAKVIFDADTLINWKEGK